MLVACLVALIAQDVPTTPSTLPVSSGTERIEDVVFRPASPDEVRDFVRDSFRTMDKDGSGWIERAEAPEGGIYTGRPTAAVLTTMHGRVGQAMTIAQADTDGDGRISEAEFVGSRLPIFAGRGVPANWRGGQASAAPAASVGGLIDEEGHAIPARKVGMDEAAAFIGPGFDAKDKDRSGFLDPRETSALEPRDAQRDKTLPPAPPADRADPAGEVSGWRNSIPIGTDGSVAMNMCPT